jgi:hypothetical protein
LLEAAVAAHHQLELRPLLVQGFLPVVGVDDVDEVAVGEHESLGAAPPLGDGLPDLLPVSLHPLLRSRAAREPGVGAGDPLEDAFRQHRHVVIVGVGQPRAARNPHRRHLGGPGLDGDLAEAVEAALEVHLLFGEEPPHRC